MKYSVTLPASGGSAEGALVQEHQCSGATECAARVISSGVKSHKHEDLPCSGVANCGPWASRIRCT